ncbi:MAG: hypothetical protein E3J86_00915 [Candidatus Thorarchaeota archaeon]|nr:MAG: hypothetical protein E3J86_00915 [Candidatus Thorarchaeota archaeon]
MQVNPWNPLTFFVICLGFFVFFMAFMYSKGMLWFQQDNASGTDNWLTRYGAKDIATGSWGRRFVIPAAALYLILSILNVVVMNVLELSSFQRLIFLMFHFLSTFVIFIFFGVRHLRISRHVLETSTEDPFPDAREESDDLS